MLTDVPLVFSLTISRELVLVIALLAMTGTLFVRARRSK